ncbi:MAG: tRNA-(ms[2]io[6]A)-hydroxylase [Sandaracinaceae bacterium]|nr:tRNA-(ms[2]io[6]A)-hydroxylase [Sandaracinaceae bacterium]
MLGLLHPTDPVWVEQVEGDLDGLLSDHAHCEMKAAQSALSLVGGYGADVPELVDPLMALAREEAEHFAEVHKRLLQRGGAFQRPATDDYVTSLRKIARGDGSNTPALLDRFLVASLVEARSCERFKLLSERLKSEDLRNFYRDLMVSEARHFRLFTGLAENCFGVEDARSRLGTLAAREAAIAGKLPLGPKVHG